MVDVTGVLSFVEWVSDNKYVRCADGKWMRNGTGDYAIVADDTASLYVLYLKSVIIGPVIGDLNEEIRACNRYLDERNDTGQTMRPDDRYETISYTRGKSIGLIIARDALENLFTKFNRDAGEHVSFERYVVMELKKK